MTTLQRLSAPKKQRRILKREDDTKIVEQCNFEQMQFSDQMNTYSRVKEGDTSGKWCQTVESRLNFELDDKCCQTTESLLQFLNGRSHFGDIGTQTPKVF